MANKIKGLTVEIGGDTTKLGKALDNVEKQGKDLSGELKEINRPGAEVSGHRSGRQRLHH